MSTIKAIDNKIAFDTIGVFVDGRGTVIVFSSTASLLVIFELIESASPRILIALKFLIEMRQRIDGIVVTQTSLKAFAINDAVVATIAMTDNGTNDCCDDDDESVV